MNPSGADLADRLNRCLAKFKAKTVNDITEVFAYYPNMASSRLGSGSYGEVFRMKSVVDVNDPPRVVKAILKSRVSKNTMQIQHVCAELAVTGTLSHPNLNRRYGLYQTETTFYVVLELCEGRKADIETRLYHLFGRYAPQRIPEVASIVQHSRAGGPTDDATDDVLVKKFVVELGLKGEVPIGTDVFNSIVLNKKIPLRKALIIQKQILDGLAYLHSNNVVHRDIKTENVVFAEDRKATPIIEGGVVVGTRITEKIYTKIIDFGLVKYMRMTQFPTTPSPSTFGAEVSAWEVAPPLNEVAASYTPSVVAVTPCGTELYCSLEVIEGIIRGGCGKSKWVSNTEALPKFDVYGAGTVMFCMCNGRPPFRLQPSYRPVTKDERLRQISQLLERGPSFHPNCPQEVKGLISELLQNDPSMRPTASAALRNPLFRNATDTYTYEVYVNGTVVELDSTTAVTPPAAAVAEAAVVEDAGEDAAGGAADGDVAAIADVMEVVRGREDNGDGAGKGCDAEPEAVLAAE